MDFNGRRKSNTWGSRRKNNLSWTTDAFSFILCHDPQPRSKATSFPALSIGNSRIRLRMRFSEIWTDLDCVAWNAPILPTFVSLQRNPSSTLLFITWRLAHLDFAIQFQLTNVFLVLTGFDPAEEWHVDIRRDRLCRFRYRKSPSLALGCLSLLFVCIDRSRENWFFYLKFDKRLSFLSFPFFQRIKRSVGTHTHEH